MSTANPQSTPSTGYPTRLGFQAQKWTILPKPVILLPLLAVYLDALSTTLGVALGFPEGGPLASKMLSIMGPLWFSIEYLVIQALAALLYSRIGLLGVVVAVTGPWLAGWSNVFMLVLLLG